MHTEVHSRKSYQKAHRNACHLHPSLFCRACQAAPKSCGTLRVTAWEGISRCRLACAFYNGKIGVKYPRSGNAEDHFQNLNTNRSCKAGKEQIKSAAFINAPKENKCQNNKQGFLAKQGNKGHQRITERCADAF